MLIHYSMPLPIWHQTQIERNRYFHRDMNSLQRLAGHWMNSFQNEIKKPDFNIANYLKVLGSVDISTESDKSGDKTQKSKITGS